MLVEMTERKTMRLNFFVLAVLSLTLASTLVRAGQSALSGPPIAYEDAGACPFEGCVYREWQAIETVIVRRARFANGAIAFTARKGEAITALTGVVVTTSPGQVRFRKPVNLSSSSGSVHVEPGETLYLLTYRGEGFTKAWFKGKFYEELDGSTAFFNDICATDPNRCAGAIVEQPKQVWWVQIKNGKGQIGWTNKPDKFDRKDALGN
jgi:hypothetical protein